MNELTIVMYHYVRDLQNSAYPCIKGLDVAAFRRQLDYLQANYTFVPTAELLACIKQSAPLPRKACWLTFDDGYRDHYEAVFPELVSRGIDGAFFPPATAVTEREILDVNKIHFILASGANVEAIVGELRALYAESGLTETTGRSFRDLYTALAHASRFDTAEVIFIKRLLQHGLPDLWRTRFADQLFRKYVTADARGFADDLYLSGTQLAEMIDAGMYVGSHGYRHLWFSKQTREAQTEKIRKSLEFLAKLGAPTHDWVMCYPYGDYNNETLEILNGMGCLAGLTTHVAVADLQKHPRLELPRLDTNDLPQ